VTHSESTAAPVDMTAAVPLVSCDGHIGPRPGDLRPYRPAELLDDYDTFARELDDLAAQMGSSPFLPDGLDVPEAMNNWALETGDPIKATIGTNPKPVEPAWVLLFLASPEASLINGQIIWTDQGMMNAALTGQFDMAAYPDGDAG